MAESAACKRYPTSQPQGVFALDAPVVFLDFDGVLRRNSAPGGRLERGLIDNLEHLFARFTRLHGVFSTNWRLHQSLRELRAHLSAPLAARFIDVTPEVHHAGMASRYSEILAWRHAVGHTGAWLARDDRAAEFPTRCPQLCLCDAERGFDAAMADQCGRQLVVLVADTLQQRSR